MQLNGIIFEDAGTWLADLAGLDLMVQGSSRDEAFLEMQEVFAEEFPTVAASFSWLHQPQGVFSVKFKKPGQVLHLMIRRHREAVERPLAKTVGQVKGMTVEQWRDIESGSQQTTTAQFLAMLDALDLDVIISVKKRSPVLKT